MTIVGFNFTKLGEEKKYMADIKAKAEAARGSNETT